jgi:molybdopterin-guanine dinucleotide biosynthesis adapter protein
MKIIAVYGSSKSGKTTTVVEIIKELRLRGNSVATIKDIHVRNFVFDVTGKDAWRHWKAGAEVVGLRAPHESVLMIKRPTKLNELIPHIRSDYLLLEGFRSAALPKILCAIDEADAAREIQDDVFCVSGLVSAHLSTFKGVPVVNALLFAADLVDLVERKAAEL